MPLPLLPLEEMAERHRGLTPAIAETYREAATVCLSIHHLSPQAFTLDNPPSSRLALVEWQPPDERCHMAWANISDATRDGAYACALAATELSCNLYAIKRAETLTGADYYIGSEDCSIEDLEECYRLEVSGTNLGRSEVYRRLKMKVKQTEEGNSSLPAMAVVVGFKVRVIAMQFVNEVS